MGETKESVRDAVAALLDNDPGRDPSKRWLPSQAKGNNRDSRIDQLVIPDEERGRMPFTQEKYVVRENASLVRWEREVRKFLRRLSPEHGHRVSAGMIYEWATGLRIVDVMAAGRSVTADTKYINRILRWYFGDPYSTYICGSKVKNAYRVRKSYYITRHRPMTLTLYAEYADGTLQA